MKNIKACYTHKTDDWKTPTDMYKFFIKVCGFIDCFEYKSKEDQFKKTYYNSQLYINPPFSRLKDMPNYIRELVSQNNYIVMLMPARTDTKYFHELLELNPEITFIKGRLKFNDAKTAPFPTILLTFHKNRLLKGKNYISRERETFTA